MRHVALFDLDGTLIPNASAELTFFKYLLTQKHIGYFNVLRLGGAFLRVHKDPRGILRGNKRYLRKLEAEKIASIADDYFKPRIEKMLFPVMREKIEYHRERGDVLLLLSGTLDFIADCFYRHLQFDGLRAVELERKGDKFSGQVGTIIPFGFGKLEALRDLLTRHNGDANHVTAYANAYTDRYILNTAKAPFAVNPDRKLKKYALKRKWKIIEP